MLVPFIVGLTAVTLTFFSQSRQNGLGLKAAFGVIFVFLALRYDYGNDYMGYLRHFEDFRFVYSHRAVDISAMWWEPGWVLLNIFFQPVGFFAMVMFTSLLNCVVIYRFIRNFAPAPYHWLAVFLYVFNPYLLLVAASAMRQNMAILLFLVGIEFLYKKRLVGYFLLVAAGWSFHQSALLLVPIAALAFYNFRINMIFAVLCICVYASLYVYGEQVFSFVTSVTGAWLDYEHYEGGRAATVNLGLGVAYSVVLFLSVLYFASVEFIKTEGGENEEVLPEQAESFPSVPARRLLFKLAIVSFMFTPMAFQLALISRINMYFTIVTIAVYPIIAATTRNALYRLLFLGSLIPYTLYAFVTFFRSPVWMRKFGTYQTIFSALNW